MFLNCHTYFSLRYGTLSPRQLAEKAAQWNIRTLALTDINNTSCASEFIGACRSAGINPVLGIDFRDADGQQLFIGLARNAAGWKALNRLLSEASLQGKPLPPVAPVLEHVWIVYPKLVKPIHLFRENELLGIRPEHVNRLFNHELLRFPQKLAALHPVSFLDDEGYRLHRLLRAIDKNTLLDKLLPKDGAKKTDRLLPPEAAEALYRQYPQLIQNTHRVLESCQVSLECGLSVNRQAFTGSKDGDFLLLEKLALSGCRKRYPDQPLAAKALERVRKEMETIRNQDFCAYFLIAWDVVRYAQSTGYHHVGRGSGANSIVAYCLFITDVDPLELDLYFERFINPYRASPPDFDIDFSWDERDDITDYLFKRYGKEHVALIATYNTFQKRAAIRELGKVYGLPKAEIDKLPDNPDSADSLTEPTPEILRYAALLDGFPNYLSIHAGGVLISERSLYEHTALQMMPKGFPVTQFDMHHAEAIGFHKFDILSQRGLGHIKDAVDLAYQNQGQRADVHDITRIKEDERVKALLRSGHCIGCFYIESPAMRGLLHKLRCEDYVHLVAASSIIRPGVARSGMMREYIRRFHQPHGFAYPHPVFRERLGETFGVMVYQEDVMKIVHHFAGLGLDESDILRRIMSGKKYKDDTFERLRRKYFDNCSARGYSTKLAEDVWKQIESFSGYSFCKAHSASFAVESFQSLFLKAYFPLEFMVAVINNFGGFYATEYYVHEARMLGGQIHAPCVNHSAYLTTLRGTDVYLGFVHLHQMERQTAHRIAYQRACGGLFRSLADFVSRVDIHPEQLELLIRIGAFRFTGKSKFELLWEKNALFNPRHGFDAQPRLFEEDPAEGGERPQYGIPGLPDGPHDQAFDEIELLGFPLCSPFDLLPEEWRYRQGVAARDFPQYLGRVIDVPGYYVCQKPVRTAGGQRMAFGTWLDREGRYFDTTHFPNFLQQHPFQGKGAYAIQAKVVEEYGFYSLEVIRMERLPYVRDGRFG
ncbi:MAG: DNA polymerase III subunit alpha [Haliscomenobacter sp.]|nr:DNA polymerase III subunit alpha [Haliscomenobacter sp.]